MMVPTKPGFYWWQWSSDARWIVIEVWAYLTTPKNLMAHINGRSVGVEEAPGIWGERIPDNDTLKATREYSAVHPGCPFGKE